MPSFTIRVLLREPTTLQMYLTLAARLRAQKVVDVVRGQDGRLYRLPAAEYHYVGNLTLAQVRDGVQAIVSTVTPRFRVLVTEGLCAWAGLEPVAEASANQSEARRTA